MTDLLCPKCNNDGFEVTCVGVGGPVDTINHATCVKCGHRTLSVVCEVVALRAENKRLRIASNLLERATKCALFIDRGIGQGMSACPADWWREVHAYVDDPERFVEETDG